MKTSFVIFAATAVLAAHNAPTVEAVYGAETMENMWKSLLDIFEGSTRNVADGIPPVHVMNSVKRSDGAVSDSRYWSKLREGMENGKFKNLDEMAGNPKGLTDEVNEALETSTKVKPVPASQAIDEINLLEATTAAKGSDGTPGAETFKVGDDAASDLTKSKEMTDKLDDLAFKTSTEVKPVPASQAMDEINMLEATTAAKGSDGTPGATQALQATDDAASQVSQSSRRWSTVREGVENGKFKPMVPKGSFMPNLLPPTTAYERWVYSNFKAVGESLDKYFKRRNLPLEKQLRLEKVMEEAYIKGRNNPTPIGRIIRYYMNDPEQGIVLLGTVLTAGILTTAVIGAVNAKESRDEERLVAETIARQMFQNAKDLDQEEGISSQSDESDAFSDEWTPADKTRRRLRA